MRRSRMPEEIHRPEQPEEAREEPLEGGTGAGHGYGKQIVFFYKSLEDIVLN